MAALSSVLWILGFTLSVVIAPQLRMWTWGPTMLCFGAATLAALPVLFRKDMGREALYVLIPGAATALWIAVRAYLSPVAELALQDLLLVSMAVSTFIVFRAAGGGVLSGRLLVGGIALLLAANLWVIARQMADPAFSPVFPVDKMKALRGFYGHYSYCASFLIPSSLLLAGLALHGRLHGVSRALLFALAGAGLAAVVLTNSRGGVVGAGAGVAAFAFGSLLIGKRDGRRWFVPLAIIAPLALIGGTVVFLGLLQGVQEQRGGGELSGMLDNTIRFYLLGIAMTCISLHPWLGGGSRSFSWECFQAWDVSAYGSGRAKPEHVHNELVQTVSEYGIIGGVLLLVFLGCVVVAAFAGTLSKDRQTSHSLSDGWRIGGLAGLAGLFVQSNFEGIFRIPPGAILLGLCLAAASVAAARPAGESKTRKAAAGYWLLAVFAIATIPPLLSFGWKGTKASLALWPAYFSKSPLGTEPKIDALSRGIAAWPMNPLHQQRGVLYRELADGADAASGTRRELLGLALDDFKLATGFHPLEPINYLNQAGTLILLGRETEAEPLLREAVKVQGNMESTFNANHRLAEYLLAKGTAEYENGDFPAAIATLRNAAEHMDTALELSENWSLGHAGTDLKINIRSTLGQALEAAGDYRGALGEYDFVINLRLGGSGHYLAARLLGKRAVAAWGERRPEDALRLFMDAEARCAKAILLPEGVTPADRNAYLAYLRKNIKFLTGAKVKPSAKVDP